MPSPLPPLRISLLTLKSNPKPLNLSLFAQNRHHQHHRQQRLFSTTSHTSSSLPFRQGPSPPRLPKEEQDLFETLQRQSTGAFSTPVAQPQSKRQPPQINQSPDSTPSDIADAESVISRRTDKLASQQSQNPSTTTTTTNNTSSSSQDSSFQRTIEACGQGEELHPNVRRGAKPEFEGDVNPKTGEVGGPKSEPLRWGSAGEWSYNGRTTDF